MIALHVATSLAELNERSQVALGSSKAKPLTNSLPKLFSAAESKREEGDEETAYVHYMKFIAVTQAIMRKSEYKEDKKYYDAMIDMGKLKRAIGHSEALSQSLSKRYQERISKASKEQKEKEEEAVLAKRMAHLEVTAQKKNGGVAAALNGDARGYRDMEPKVLYSLISERSTSFLLLDARPSSDYDATHIKHPYSLNIPEEILKAGSTSKALERNMPVQSRGQWHRRTTTDKIIILDWSSQRIEPKSPLEYLRDAMYKWEGAEYLCKMPYVLLGGFDNFAIRYPQEVTDHNKAKLLSKNRLNNAAKSNTPNLSEIRYPDPSLLDNGFLVTPSPSPKSAPKTSHEVDSRDDLTPPVPNRGSKPKLLPARKENSDVSRSSDSISSVSSSRSSNEAGPLNNGFLNSRASETTDESKSNPPKVDRSLKAKALLLQMNTNRGKGREILEAEQDLAEDSVRLEQQELEMEQQWLRLRLRREKEAEEGMKEELMKNEEALLEKISNLVEEKKKKDRENDDLRIQLNGLKTELDSRWAKNVNEQVSERNAEEGIRQRDLERRRLQAEVEEKRRERKMKQREQLVEAHKKQQAKEEEEARRKVEAQSMIEKKKDARPRLDVIRLPLRDEGTTSNFGDLNRSHSSPNIAQMLEKEDRAFNFPAPRFDRNIKPSDACNSHARGARNFQPVWGTAKKGLTGLKNLGNTCYMNSILQCLSNFTIPAQYFIDMAFKQDLNNNSETKGEVAIEFSEVIRALWCGQYKSIAPSDLKRTVGRYMESFKGSSQQDAHEFLTKLMDWLNDDLNAVRRKVRLPPEVDYKGMDERTAAEAAWEMQKCVEKSFIQETFYGQTRSTCTCNSCGFRSYKFEKFLGLTLMLPSGNGGKWSLHQCIQDLLREELVDYVCEKCKQRSRKATKKLEIVRLPLILTVHLKRFYRDYEIDVWRKKPNYVDFELTDFNAGRYVTACGGSLNHYKQYQLYGVCNHFGSMEGGHYTAYCYSQVYGKWYKYDDHVVSSMRASDVKTSAAYILFYSAKN